MRRAAVATLMLSLVLLSGCAPGLGEMALRPFAGQGRLTLSTEVQQALAACSTLSGTVAFAVSADGRQFGASHCRGGPCRLHPVQLALYDCNAKSATGAGDCALYAYAGRVVWRGAVRVAEAAALTDATAADTHAALAADTHAALAADTHAALAADTYAALAALR